MRRAALAIAALTVTACGGGPDPPPPDACALGADGAPWLAFASRRTGDYEIWRTRADGTCLARVTDDPAADLFPTWSGSTVAFASERGGKLHLRAFDLAAGTDVAIDTGDLLAATTPAFSPDGAWIAFEGRAASAAAADVLVVPASGGAPVALAPDAASDGGPAWSPDGLTIYFVSTRSGRHEVWKVSPAGGEATQVTTGSRIIGKPAVTVDGTALLFARTISGSTLTEVVRLDLSSGQVVAVVSSLDDSEPAVSPDGTHLALRSFRDGHADIVVAALDGSGAVLLTSDGASDGVPAFALAP
jgi:TolB protein